MSEVENRIRVSTCGISRRVWRDLIVIGCSVSDYVRFVVLRWSLKIGSDESCAILAKNKSGRFVST